MCPAWRQCFMSSCKRALELYSLFSRGSYNGGVLSPTLYRLYTSTYSMQENHPRLSLIFTFFIIFVFEHINIINTSILLRDFAPEYICLIDCQ